MLELPAATPWDPGPGKPKGQPLRIWMPDSLRDLYTRVQLAAVEGRLDEAIQMIQQALPTAHGPYEQSSLKAVLASLKARKAGR